MFWHLRSSTGSQLVCKTYWERNIHYFSPYNSVELLKLLKAVNAIHRNKVYGQMFYNNCYKSSSSLARQPLAFLRSFAHSSLLRATFFQFMTPNILISWRTPSSTVTNTVNIFHFIPKSSQNHLRSKHLNVNSFQIEFTDIIQSGMNPHGHTQTEDDAMTTVE